MFGRIRRHSHSPRRTIIEAGIESVVLAELLSDPKLPTEVAETLAAVPLVELRPGYWQRAGALRSKVLAKRREARLGDALIAQSCMDRGIPLLTRDRDFWAFAEAAGLQLVIGPAAACLRSRRHFQDRRLFI